MATTPLNSKLVNRYKAKLAKMMVESVLTIYDPTNPTSNRFFLTLSFIL